MMDKRVIVAIVVSVGILFGWAKLFPTPTPPKPTSSTANVNVKVNVGDTKSVPLGSEPVPALAPAPGTQAAGSAGAGAGGSLPGATANPERQTVVRTSTEEFIFSNRGAALRHARLLGAKFLLRAGDSTSGVDLVRSEDPSQAPLRIAFPDSGFPTPADTAWRLVEGGAPDGVDQVLYRAETPAVVIEKRFLIDRSNYRLHLDVTVENRSAAPQDHHLSISLFGHQDPEAKGGFLSGSTGNTASILCHADDKTVREGVEKLQKDPFEESGSRQLDWRRREVLPVGGGSLPRDATARAQMHGDGGRLGRCFGVAVVRGPAAPCRARGHSIRSPSSSAPRSSPISKRFGPAGKTSS